MNARLYDPELGRFLSADSIVPDPTRFEDYNRYMYVRGNPMRYRDPSGHSPESEEDDVVELEEVVVDGTDWFADAMDSVVIKRDRRDRDSSITQEQSPQERAEEQARIANQAALEEMRQGYGEKTILLASASGYDVDVIEPFVDPLRHIDKLGGGVGGFKVKTGIRGLETRGIKPAPGTRVRPEGIPRGWRIRPTKSKGGTEYYNPRNPNESVRVMQGNSNRQYPNSQRPYARQRDSSGSYLDSNGNRGVNKSSDTHIPLDQFKFRE